MVSLSNHEGGELIFPSFDKLRMRGTTAQDEVGGKLRTRGTTAQDEV